MAGVKGMRTGGQNRKPTALHLLQGTFRRHRHGGVTPEVPGGVPEAPGKLSGEAQAEWTRMVTRLTATGTLTAVDGSLLWNYVQLWAGASRLQADADALTRTWFEKTSVDGAGVEHREPKLHPVFAALKQYRLALRVYLVEFGLTPLARNRVMPAGGVTTPVVDPKKARYFNATK